MTANREINVRARPADWKKSTFTLKIGETVVVADLRTLPISGARTQVWIGLEAAPNQIGVRAGAAQPSAAPANNVTELRIRRQFWEEQVFNCKVVSDVYPSKNDKTYDPMRRYNPAIPKQDWEPDYISENDCDDGDMDFFNGLLCPSGDDRGCKGVAIAQDRNAKNQDGRWWRSKRLVGEPDTKDHASFSTEQGLSVKLYLIKTADKAAFVSWLKFIEKNPRTYNAVLPSFCTHKECVFKVIDCPLLVTVASAFGSTTDALRVCNPLRSLGIPTPDELVQNLEGSIKSLLDLAKRYEDLFKQLLQPAQAAGLPSIDKLLPSVDDLRRLYQASVAAYEQLRERVLGPQIGEAAARLAQFIALVNSVVNSLDVDDIKFNVDTGKLVYNKDGFRIEGANVSATGAVAYNPNGEHIAAVEVFLLRNLGYQSDELNKATEYAWERDKDNPFFEYLVHQRSARMLELILNKCPSRANPSVTRFQ